MELKKIQFTDTLSEEDIYNVFIENYSSSITDFFQFVLAMIGSVWACFYIINLDQIGGISSLIENPIVQNKIALMPDFSDPDILVNKNRIMKSESKNEF